VLVLFLLAPTVAEILLGDLLLKASFVPTLVMYLLLYGSGALLVREIARRRRLGWSGIVVLGLAYGVVEEGLILQTLFNPHFPGLGILATYGRSLGVSWFWTVSVLGEHAIWSITLPIFLTEQLFPDRADRPWLGRVGLVLDAIIYLLTALVMSHFFTIYTHFSAPPPTLLITALTAVIFVVVSLLLVSRGKTASISQGLPAMWIAGLTALLAGALFFGIRYLPLFFPIIPAILPILLYGVVYFGTALLIRRWATTSGWTVQHQLALASGALLTYMLYGFRLVVAKGGGLADLLFHGSVCMVFAGLLARMFIVSRKYRNL